MSGRLPSQFADLEPFADTWCLDSETQRFEQRLDSTMPEMQDFYDAFFPRLEEAIDYCDKFGLDDLPEDAENLLTLIYSLVNVSMAIEIFHQPKTIDAADAVLMRIRGPRP
jgi:hypothetical protein